MISNSFISLLRVVVQRRRLSELGDSFHSHKSGQDFEAASAIHGTFPIRATSANVRFPSAVLFPQFPQSKQKFVAVPYYTWAHPGEGEMTVLFREKLTAVDLISK